ncbi:unnamed protein product [Meloidogyne enterolobii]|uniref:Uncharacterized protein n=1 Tax=Meloidogyne enterolobii TaxID=390850 RepID=A0ACB0ZQS3_MELEN
MTLTESHHFISILIDWENVKNVETKGKLKEILSDEKYFKYFERNVKNNKNINFGVLAILNKIGNSKDDINLNLPKLEKALRNFETNIKYKSKLIECSLYAKILHFTALEIDNEDEVDGRKIDGRIETSIDNHLKKEEDTKREKSFFRRKTDTIFRNKKQNLKKIDMKYKLRKLFLEKLQKRLEQSKQRDVNLDIEGSAPDFLTKVINDFKTQCKFGESTKNTLQSIVHQLNFFKKENKEDIIKSLNEKITKQKGKVEKHFEENLKKEINKRLTEDEEFKRKLKERTLDLFNKRLNLKKYLKRMAKRTRKFIKYLKKIKNELDNENILLKDLKKLKKFKKLDKMERMLEELKKEVKEEDEAYRDRFISKFEFLDKNWKEFVKSNKKLTKLAEDGHLFIGYCLAKRFQFIFNNEGQAKTKFYEETNSHLFNYASEINQILGNKRVDLE